MAPDGWGGSPLQPGSDSQTEAPGSDQAEDQAPDTNSEDEKSEEEQFRDEQKRQAAEQGLTADNAVPEARPASFDTSAAQESDITRKLRESGEDNSEPMGKEAYDRASSDEQRDAAAEDERVPALSVADAVEVVDEDSPHFGRRGSITRTVFSNEGHAQRSGQPAQRFIQPEEVEVSTRGDARGGEILMLQPDQLKKISVLDLKT